MDLVIMLMFVLQDSLVVNLNLRNWFAMKTMVTNVILQRYVIFLHLPFLFEVHFQFFLQKCSSNVKGNSAPTLRDYNYDDDEVDLVPKRGEDENEYCPIGETCCIPEIPKCEDFEGYSCTSEDVSFSL